MNETINVLKSRRSCRKFTAEMVKKEDLEQILEAGTYAPSGKNLQSAIIIAVTNKDLREKLRIENAKIAGLPSDRDPFYGAPVILIVLADKKAANHVYDGTLVMGNLLNAAAALGLGSIWIHRAREEFDSDFGKQILKDLHIEGDYEGIGHVALGYKAEGGEAKAAPRKENYVYYAD